MSREMKISQHFGKLKSSTWPNNKIQLNT